MEIKRHIYYHLMIDTGDFWNCISALKTAACILKQIFRYVAARPAGLSKEIFYKYLFLYCWWYQSSSYIHRNGCSRLKTFYQNKFWTIIYTMSLNGLQAFMFHLHYWRFYLVKSLRHPEDQFFSPDHWNFVPVEELESPDHFALYNLSKLFLSGSKYKVYSSGSKLRIDPEVFWAPDGLPDQNLRMTEVGCVIGGGKRHWKSIFFQNKSYLMSIQGLTDRHTWHCLQVDRIRYQ